MFWEEPEGRFLYNGKQTGKGFRSPAGFWTRETEHPAAPVLAAFPAPCTKTHGYATGIAPLATPALFHAPPPLTPCSSLATFKAGKSSGHAWQLRPAQQEDAGIAPTCQRAHLASSLGTFTLQGERRRRFARSPRRARCVPALVGNGLTAVGLQRESEVSGEEGRSVARRSTAPGREETRGPPTLERRRLREDHGPLSRTGVIPRRKIPRVHFLFFPTKHMQHDRHCIFLLE